jgi:hypothetical protein
MRNVRDGQSRRACGLGKFARGILIAIALAAMIIPCSGDGLNTEKQRIEAIDRVSEALGIPYTIEDMSKYSSDGFDVDGMTFGGEDGIPYILIDSEILTDEGVQNTEEYDHEWYEDHSYAKTASLFAASVDEDGFDTYGKWVYVHEAGHYLMYMYTNPFGSCDGIDCVYGPVSWNTSLIMARNGDWEYPTEYSATNDAEMFAECFTLYVSGHQDMLAPEIILFIDKMENFFQMTNKLEVNLNEIS